MFQENSNIESAGEESIKVWRYMDIAQLISMLDKQALFFVRSDKLQDSFEGLLTKASINSLDSLLEEVNDNDPCKYIAKQVIDIMKGIPKKGKPYFYINSWHKSEYESMAMWSIYAKSNKGISIQSNFQKLKECLLNSHYCYNEELIRSPFIHLRDVKYVNTEIYCQDLSHKNWSLNCYFNKLQSYDYEREVRAVIDLTAESDDQFDYKEIIENNGIYIYISLDFIEKIFVCPLAPNWVLDVVKSIAEKYGVGEAKVVRSNLITDRILR